MQLKLYIAKSVRIYVLPVMFPILSEKLSGISLPCLLLFEHKYQFLVCGGGPCCFLVFHFIKCLMATLLLAVAAKLLKGKLSAVAQPSF